MEVGRFFLYQSATCLRGQSWIQQWQDCHYIQEFILCLKLWVVIDSYCYKEGPIATSGGKKVRVELEMEELVLQKEVPLTLNTVVFKVWSLPPAASALLGNFLERQTYWLRNSKVELSNLCFNKYSKSEICKSLWSASFTKDCLCQS